MTARERAIAQLLDTDNGNKYLFRLGKLLSVYKEKSMGGSVHTTVVLFNNIKIMWA